MVSIWSLKFLLVYHCWIAVSNLLRNTDSSFVNYYYSKRNLLTLQNCYYMYICLYRLIWKIKEYIFHCERSCLHIGHVGFSAAHPDIHLSWNTCFYEHGSTITCSSSIMFWKHIEHGDPSDFWIISTVADTASGRLAFLAPSIQQHAYKHTRIHNKGISAIKIKQRNTCICTKNSDTKNKVITTI